MYIYFAHYVPTGREVEGSDSRRNECEGNKYVVFFRGDFIRESMKVNGDGGK
jgi:hypothetical protein